MAWGFVPGFQGLGLTALWFWDLKVQVVQVVQVV